jgi:hypothetical protein
MSLYDIRQDGKPGILAHHYASSRSALEGAGTDAFTRRVGKSVARGESPSLDDS